MSLNLPKPVNSYAGEDELRKAPAPVEETPEDTEEYRPPRRSDKFKTGMIYPPKEIRVIIDKTALHIFKSPTPDLLEDKIREHQKNDVKFSFLSAEDPYYQYYKYSLEKAREDAEDLAKGLAQAVVEKKVQEITTTATEPKAHEFRVDLPGVTAHDLDILRLTALFHARRGRAFLSALSVREGRNYQFDFLRPTHSLYGYYNRMVESYQRVMTPPPDTVETLRTAATDPRAKWTILEEGRNRAEWETYRRRRADIKQKEQDEEADAFAVIDWQDFVVVETIEFTQTDLELNLPPPSSVEQLRNRSMGEKRMATMIMEEVPEEEIEAEEDEDLRLARIKEEKEQARAREVQRAAMESRGMKIKKDYVPKGITRGVVATAICPNCKQSIPENELAEHVRIELLDPRWKEQKRQLDQRRQAHLQLNQGADITTSLRNLASARTDLFGDETDEATRKAREEEEKRKRREREKIIWDGHTASATKTTDTFQQQFRLDDQIRQMHQRMGLTEETTPKIGPVPAGATISAPPSGPIQKEYYESTGAPTPGNLPVRPSQAVHPSRAAVVQAANAPAPVPAPAPEPRGQTRPAPEDGPPAKRAKVEKLAFGLYSDVDWMSLHPHPIALAVRLPAMPERPEWKLDGSVLTVPNVPVNTAFSIVREFIKRTLDADLPVSRLQIQYEGKIMGNSQTLAGVNIGEGDEVTLVVKRK